jgi:hypothetical protein
VHTLPTAVSGSLLHLHFKTWKKNIFPYFFSIFCSIISRYVSKRPTITVTECVRSVPNTADIFPEPRQSSQILSPWFILIVPTKRLSWLDGCVSVCRPRQSIHGLVTTRGRVVGQPALKRSAFLLWKRLVCRRLRNSVIVDAVNSCWLISITQREKNFLALGVCHSYDLSDKRYVDSLLSLTIKKTYLANYVASFVSGQRWRPWPSHNSRGI